MLSVMSQSEWWISVTFNLHYIQYLYNFPLDWLAPNFDYHLEVFLGSLQLFDDVC